MARAKAAQQTPGWVWLLAGLLIGLFVAFLVYINAHNVSVQLAAKPADGKGKPTPAGEKPKFEFYTILPDMEVVVNDANEAKQDGVKPKLPPEPTPAATPATNVTTPAVVTTEPEPQKPAEPPASTGKYILQLGSFQRFEDADRMKANLALLGMQASVEKVIINGNQTWHRVRIGPNTSIKELDGIRAELKRNRINAVLVKVGGR